MKSKKRKEEKFKTWWKNRACFSMLGTHYKKK